MNGDTSTAPTMSRALPVTVRPEVHSLSVVIPLYRSEDTIGSLVDHLVRTLSEHFKRLQIVLVEDASPDRTRDVVLELVHRHPGIVNYYRLSRNFGEHNAVMCGLHHAVGDAVAIIDDDWQNPPEEILRMVEELRTGYDVVYSFYAVKHHSWFRNLGSRFTNWVATLLLPKPRDLYLSSFKVMSSFLARTVTSYTGPYPYLDGLVLRSTSAIGAVQVRHQPRTGGRSNYNLRRLVRLWLNMFTGFSVTPLRIAAILGLVMSGVGFLMAVLFLISWFQGGLFVDQAIPPGWASLIVTVTLFGGVQLCLLGLLGEYVGRILLTQNRSPQFIIREAVETPWDEKRGEA